MTSLLAHFGTLRSLLNQTSRTDAQHQQLWSLLNLAYKTDPEVYQSQWLPYLKGYPIDALWCAVEDLTALAAAIEVIPFGFFELDLSAHHAPILSSVLASPLLRHVRSLNCTRMFLKCEHAAQVAACVHFNGTLTTLKLAHNAIECEGLDALADSPYLSALRVLDVGYNAFKEDGLMALLHSPHITTLESLDLSGNQLASPDIARLCQSPHLSHMTSLSLRENFLDAHAVSHLAQTPALSGLESLDLSQNARPFKQLKSLANDAFFDFDTVDVAYESLGEDASLQALCEKLSWQILGTEHALAFEQTYIGNQAMRVLAQSPYLKQLRCLKLSGNVIGKPGVDALAQSLPALRSLDLSDNFINHRAMSSLREALFFKQLESLNLSRNPIYTVGVRALFNATEPLPLRRLVLSDCVIESQGAEYLAAAPCLTSLQELDVSVNAIAFQGAAPLIQKRALEHLNLNHNRLTRTIHGGPDVPLPEFHDQPLSLLSLRLAFCDLEDIDMVWLSYLLQSTSLEALFLDGNEFTEEGLFMLAHVEPLQSLSHLDIAWYECRPEALRAVLGSPYLPEAILQEARDALTYLM